VSFSLDEVAAVVLAGGFGTRVQHLLPGIPKPMAPVLGRPFIDWVVRYLAKQGVHQVVLSTGYLAETVEHHFEIQPVPGVRLRCVVEESPLGTAGGFLNAVRQSGLQPAAWLVLNGDSLALAPLQSLLAAFDNPAASGAILGVRMMDASRYGTLLADDSGRLVGFEEKKPGAGVINAGVYLLGGDTLRRFPSKTPLSFEKDVFPELISRRLELRVCCVSSPFLDIGTPESLPQSERFIGQNRAQFVEA
jgi:D-glycero-alpha-D-manno-heptose 1-phosphate guanylyltransferase